MGGFSRKPVASGGSSTLTINNKSAAYTVVADDLGEVINCTSGTFTVSLTESATLGAGFCCWIWNSSATATDVITIDPSGAETIDGIAARVLYRGQGVQIVSDGVSIQTGDGKMPRLYSENCAASSLRPYAVGAGSVVLGVSYASGVDAFAAAIANNASSYGATGANSTALGQTCKASGTNSSAIGGYLCLASGAYSYAFGASASYGAPTASGTHSVAFGDGCSASGTRSWAIGGAAVAALVGKYSYASGRFAANGDAQSAIMVLRRATADAAPTVLTSDEGAPDTSNQVVIPNNSTYTFRARVTAMQKASEGAAYAGYEITGVIKRGANAAATTLLASTVTALFETAAGWDCVPTADTTNGGLALTVAGAAATNIRWVAVVDTTELTYA